MKTIKLTLALICCLLTGNTVFANYVTVYQCGFEENGDILAWDLQTAAGYIAADPEEYQGYRDYFFIGEAAAYEGSKSLYVSNDNGVTNNMTATQGRFGNDTGSYADLQITLTPGTYTLDFVYKMKSPASLTIVAIADRFNFGSYKVFFNPYPAPPIAYSDTWTAKQIEFKVTETVNWITFWYEFNTRDGGEVLEDAFAIDNIVIKKLQEFVIDENGILIDYLGAGGHVVIPDGVKGVDDRAFNTKGQLITSYFIPASVEAINGTALSWDNVTNITLDEANENYTCVDGVLYNKDKTTIVCYPAQKAGDSFTIPSSVKTIGDYAFFACANLTSITIPDGVEAINEGAISSCPNLTSITIPSSVTTIGDWALSNNRNMSEITVKWQDPTTVSYGARVLSSTPNLNTLYVPAGTAGVYGATSPWSGIARTGQIVEDAASGSTATYRGMLELILMGVPSGDAPYLVDLLEDNGTYQLTTGASVLMNQMVLDVESGNFSREGFFDDGTTVASLESGYIKGDSLVFVMDYVSQVQGATTIVVIFRGILFNGYNAADVLALNNFLAQPSAVEGKTNGEQLGLTSTGVSGLSGGWFDILLIESLIKDYTVWVNKGGYMYLQELNIPNKSLAGTLDLSGFAYLTKVNAMNNLLTGIVANEALEELNIYLNRIKLSGLPLVDNFTSWSYGYQVFNNTIVIKYDETVDLSSEAMINGIETVFKWQNASLNELEENVDYTNNNGVFTFINPELIGQMLICGMTNENFPETYVLCTVLLEAAGDVYQSLGEVYIAGNFLPMDKAAVRIFQEENGSYTLTLSATSMNPITLPNVTMTETGDGKMSLSMDNPVDLGSGFVWLSSGELDTQSNTLNVSFFSANTLEDLYLGSVRFLFRSEGTYAVISALSNNGSVTPDKDFAAAGETVTLTVNLAEGYELLGFTVVGKIQNNPNSTPIEVDDNNQFIMPESNVVITAVFKPILAEMERQGLVETVSTFEHEAEGTFGDEKSFVVPMTGTPFSYAMYVCKYNLKAGDIITGGVSGTNILVYNEQEEVQDATYIGTTNLMMGFKAETDGVYYVVHERTLPNATVATTSYYLYLYRYGTIQSISFEGEANISPEMDEAAIKSALRLNLTATGIDSYGEEIALASMLSSVWTVDMENDRAYFNPFAFPVTLLKLTLAEEIDNVVSWSFPVYDATDVLALKNFLEQPSAEEGKTNGELLGLPAVLPDNNSWIETLSNVSGISINWSNDPVKRLRTCDLWGIDNFAGNLDLSACTSLISVNCGGEGQVTGLQISSSVRALFVGKHSIKLSALPPTADNMLGYACDIQNMPEVNVDKNGWDISSELFLAGEYTTIEISDGGDVIYAEGIDYRIENGILRFINPDLLGTTVMCVMQNPAFEEVSVVYPVEISGITTSVSGAFAGNPVIYTRNLHIVVENASAPVTVYGVAGSVVGRCRDVACRVSTVEIPVPQAGVYVVKVGEMVKKVVVNN